jgi:two-component system cell cycle sensor histidine kinase/response regulator CckA
MKIGEKAKILVVEDDPPSLEFLRSLLSHSGYRVMTAENGQQALDKAKAEPPELVVSDILMPGMDGFELAYKIRLEPSLSQTRVIFYSATYHAKQASWLAKASGVMERLEKPAEPQVILEAVEKALRTPTAQLTADPYLLAEEHARVASEKVAAKIAELRENQRQLEAEIERRKRTEFIVQESETRYHSLVDDLPMGIFVCSLKEDRFLAVNPAMVKMLGYSSAEELLQRSVSGDVYQVAGEFEALKSQILSDRVLMGREVLWKRKDGSGILARASCRLSNEDFCVQGIAEDITWQRELETQLRQSQKLESLGRLTGGVAHDFNNLLMAIGGYTDLLLSKLEPDTRVRNYAEQIKKTTWRAAGLTKQLLAFSRKQVTATTVIDLKELLKDLSNMLLHLLGPQITVSINTASRPLYLEADRNQLEQVIVNLAVNARDAMPNGGALRLEAFDTQLVDDSRLPPGAYVCLSVADTGHGIEKHLQNKIFEPFFSTKGERGTGLGLATVYGIVKQAKGEVRVQSEPGQGTTFTLLLPLSVMLATEVESEAVPMVSRGHEHILLVDDEEALRLSMQEYLEATGYTVVPARNGGEALDILSKENRSIQMMVTDLTMPGVSGADLARKVWESNPAFAVLFISGYMDDAAHEFLSARPARTDYIEKPFPLTELGRKVRALLDGRPNRDPDPPEKTVATQRLN